MKNPKIGDLISFDEQGRTHKGKIARINPGSCLIQFIGQYRIDYFIQGHNAAGTMKEHNYWNVNTEYLKHTPLIPKKVKLSELV